MRNITILDLDYYHGNSDAPNPQVMKLSSYLKQKGYVINFIEEETHLKMKYDRAYVFREVKKTPPPPVEYLGNKNCILIGESFKYFAGYGELPPAVAIVRPDYQLYNFEKMTAMTRANFIQFFHDGKLLRKRQDYHNTIPGVNKLVIMDQDFWSQNEEDVIWVLEFLGTEKHVHFKYPIKISKVLTSKAAKGLFLKLHFSAGTKLIFKNDLGHTLPQLKEAIDFIGEIDAKFKNVASSKLSIAAITANHYTHPDKSSEDFMRVMKIIDYAKEKNVRLTVVAPKDRSYTPFYDQFEFFDAWTNNYAYESFVAAMVHSVSYKKKMKWWEVINSPNLWSTTRIKNIVAYLLYHREIIEQYGLRRNATEFDDINKIDFSQIEKSRFKSSAEGDNNAED